MNVRIDNLIKWALRNWFAAAALVGLFCHAVIFWYVQTTNVKITQKTGKNVEAIAKCLIKAGVLDPRDVQLTRLDGKGTITVQFKSIN